MPTEHEYIEWAKAFESGEYRAIPIEAPRVDVARLQRGRPHKGKGSHGKSPSRQVRLPQEISDQVDALAKRRHVPSSEVMRAAITEYIERHPA
ncbi:ribbon-helix-helix domain-containing protein [Mycobacterium haemophilum]